jgi:pimeloyl-ACP methyl ester carboxylesterase
MNRSLAKIKLVWPRRVREFSYHHQHRIRRGLKYLAIAVTILYFITVVISQVRINQREQSLPYQLADANFGRFLETETAKIYYEVYQSTQVQTGSKKFLLIHGFGANLDSWRYQIDYLRQLGEVVAVDLAGFGLSQEVLASSLGVDAQVKILEELMLQLGWPKAVLLGHSMGGGVALRFALDHPNRVLGLILDGSVDLSAAPDLSSLAFLNGAFGAQIPLGLADPYSFAEAGLKNAVFDDSKVDADWVETYSRSAAIKGFTSNFAGQVFAPRQNRLAELGKVSAPILLIYGKQDTVIPVEMRQNLFNGLPSGYELVELEETGHIPHEEQPVIYNQVVGEWVNRRIASN